MSEPTPEGRPYAPLSVLQRRLSRLRTRMCATEGPAVWTLHGQSVQSVGFTLRKVRTWQQHPKNTEAPSRGSLLRASHGRLEHSLTETLTPLDNDNNGGLCQT